MVYVYYIWIMLSTGFSIYGVVSYWPMNSLQDEFLLFNDIATAVIFLPAFYVLFFSILLQVILYYNSHKERIKKYTSILYILNFILLIIITEYWNTVASGILIIFIVSIGGIAHLLISIWLHPVLRQKIIGINTLI